MSKLFAETPYERVVNPEGALNFRDLGGYIAYNASRVAWRTLFRSDSLDRLTEKGVETFLRLGIRTVVNLRSENTEAEDVPGIVSAVNMIPLPWDMKGVIEDVRQTYRNLVLDNLSVFREAFLLLADTGNLPLLFHCAAGKDRTGILAAVILKSLGVADEIICADYVLTGKLTPEWRVSRDNIEAALDEVVRFGGIESFLLEHVHMDPSVLKGVRENLLVL
jgi:protein-tyrosine phosphatase